MYTFCMYVIIEKKLTKKKIGTLFGIAYKAI